MSIPPAIADRADQARQMGDRVAASVERIKTLAGSATTSKRLERLTLAARSLATDRRLGPRLPCRLSARLLLDGARHDTFSRDVGASGAMVERPKALTKPRGVEARLILEQGGEFAVRIVAMDDMTMSLAFKEGQQGDPLASLLARLRRENAAALARGRRLAIEASRALNHGLDERMFTMQALFSLERDPVSGNGPEKFSHPAGEALRRLLEKALWGLEAGSPDWLDALVMDRGGYVAAHRPALALTSPGAGAGYETLQGRTLDDFWTLRASFAKEPTVQLCPRRAGRPLASLPAALTMAGPMMKDVVVPILVRGARWGAARIGVECRQPQASISSAAESAGPNPA
jgi:hypothetical protein